MKWCTTLSLAYWPDDDINVPFDLGNDIKLIETPSWTKQSEITDKLKYWRRKSSGGNYRYSLYIEYEADSLGDPDPESPSENVRAIQDTAHFKLQRALLSFWLVKATRALNIGVLIHAQFDGSEWLWRQIVEPNDFKYPESELNTYYENNELIEVKNLIQAGAKLKITGETLKALKLLYRAIEDHDFIIRYAILWIAIEALFGTASQTGITKKLTQRLAAFLCDDSKNLDIKINEFREAYEHRGWIVHGLKFRKDFSFDQQMSVMESVENILRVTLKKILSDKQIMNMFESDKRESLLDNLYSIKLIESKN